MTEIDRLICNGTLCTKCGVFLGRSIGKPMLCKDCVFTNNARTLHGAPITWQKRATARFWSGSPIQPKQCVG